MADMHRTAPGTARPYPAQKARQGEIILKTSWQRAVFIAGLVGFVALALVLAFLR
jgi:hypothetical protein